MNLFDFLRAWLQELQPYPPPSLSTMRRGPEGCQNPLMVCLIDAAVTPIIDEGVSAAAVFHVAE